MDHRLRFMLHIKKHILCKIQDISHSKNTCKLYKKPKKYCNENNCYITASFNFKIDDRPIKCEKHKENNMINVKRKHIVNNNSKIIYKKGYVCENNKKGGSIKNNKKIKNDKKTDKRIKNNKNDKKLIKKLKMEKLLMKIILMKKIILKKIIKMIIILMKKIIVMMNIIVMMIIKI